MASNSEKQQEPSPDSPMCKPTHSPLSANPHAGGSADVEEQRASQDLPSHEKVSAFQALGWLNRYLAIWILLAMVIGVLLGNFVPETGPALQKGRLVGVSVPIGSSLRGSKNVYIFIITVPDSRRTARHDVPHPLQGTVRVSA